MTRQRTLLLTRPEAQSRAFAAALERAVPGAFRPVIAPLLTIAPIPGPLDLDGAQGLIFTSANGVEQFSGRTGERGATAWCVGASTAAAARRAGFDARSADGDVAKLERLIIAAHRDGAGPFVHVRGRHAAGDLVTRLRAAGVPARSAEIYDQIPTALTAEARDMLAAGALEVLAFFSPRTAAVFAHAASAAHWQLGGSTCVSLSGAADAALGDAVPVRRIVAAEPTRNAMIEALAGP